MELKEFVEETLVQITEGVKKAQEECKKHGGLINPMIEVPVSNAERFEIAGKYYPASKVAFRVGLSESDTAGGKRGIGVFLGKFSIGAEKAKETEIQSITSIEFDVTVVFPYITRDGKHFPISQLGAILH
jgi:hypothetical protein